MSGSRQRRLRGIAHDPAQRADADRPDHGTQAAVRLDKDKALKVATGVLAGATSFLGGREVG